MRALPAIAALILTACATALASPSAPDDPAPPSAPTSVPPAASAGVAPTARAVSLRPVAELVPSAFDGVEAHTFAVAGDLVARLAARAGVPVEELEVAYASEHGERVIQVIAVRHPSVAGDRLLELLPEVAYAPVVPDSQSVETETLAGLEVLTVDAPSLAPRLGTFHALVLDEALIVVQAFGPEASEVALRSLPEP